MEPALRRARASVPPGARRRWTTATLGFVLLLPLACITAITTSIDPASAGPISHPYADTSFQTWANMAAVGAIPTSSSPPPDVSGCPGRTTAWRAFSPNPTSPNAPVPVPNYARVCYSELPGEVHINFVEFAQFQWGCSNGFGTVGIEPDTLSLWQGGSDTISPIPRFASTRKRLDPYVGLIINLSERGYACANDQWSDLNTWSAHTDSPAGNWDLTYGDIVTFPAIYDSDVDENGVNRGGGNYYWGSQRYYATGYQPKATSACVWVHQADFLMSNLVGAPGATWNHQTSPENHWMDLCVSSGVSPSAVPVQPTPPPTPGSTPTPPGQPAPPSSPAPPPDNAPTGSLIGASFTKNGYQLRVFGTASDPEATSVKVDFYAPGSGQWVGSATTANGGFDSYVTLPALPVDYRVCAAVENVGSQWFALNRWIGCLDPDKPPVGQMGNAKYTGAGLNVQFTGFATDADTNNPLRVDLVMDDGQILGTTTTGAASLAGTYGSAGFDTTVQMPSRYLGLRVCAWARDFGGYKDTQITCLVPRSVPIGNLDVVVPVGLNTFSVRGWAVQPGANAPSAIKVTGGSQEVTAIAFTSRPDVEVAFPGLGANHGFDATVTVAPGTANLCVTGVNQLGAGGGDRQLGCHAVENHTPVGNLEVVKRKSPMTFQLAGWTVDPTTTWSIFTDVWIDPGTPSAAKLGHVAANLPRADLASAWATGINAGYGGNHGFDVTVTVPGTVPTGPHNLCAYGATWNRPDDNRLIACRQIDTDADSAPVGGLDDISPVRLVNGVPVMNVAGWALDPDLAASAPDASLEIHLYWTGQAQGYPYPGAANLSRPDLAPTYQGWGLNHGFNVTVPMPDGSGPRELCAYAINRALGQTNTKLGCKTITAPGHDPFGNLETVSGARWSNGPIYQLAGWSIDPDGTAPTGVDVWWDPGTADAMKVTNLPIANQARTDVEAGYPGYGQAHGFTVNVPPPNKPGVHLVCAYGLNTVGARTSGTLGCKTITTTGHDPAGALDIVQAGYNASPGIRVAGWELDPDSAGTGTVHIYVDGAMKATLTDVSKPRSDLWVWFFGYGPNHGFDTVIGGVGPGTHSVCAYGINSGPGTANPLLGACKTVTLGSDPLGLLEVASKKSGAPTTLTVGGWTLDPDTTAALTVHVYVDSAKVGEVTANVPRPDVGAAYVGYGDGHGFNVDLPGVLAGLTTGNHNVCAYGIGVTAGGVIDNHNPLLGGCRTVTV